MISVKQLIKIVILILFIFCLSTLPTSLDLDDTKDNNTCSEIDNQIRSITSFMISVVILISIFGSILFTMAVAQNPNEYEYYLKRRNQFVLYGFGSVWFIYVLNVILSNFGIGLDCLLPFV